MIETFFNSESDRDLWLKLNAEHQIEREKSLTYFCTESNTNKPTKQALNPRSMEDALRIARNQLDYDVKNGELRFTLEEYLMLNAAELTIISKSRQEKWVKKMSKK
jgi:hypothetical protein